MVTVLLAHITIIGIITIRIIDGSNERWCWEPALNQTQMIIPCLTQTTNGTWRIQIWNPIRNMKTEVTPEKWTYGSPWGPWSMDQSQKSPWTKDRYRTYWLSLWHIVLVKPLCAITTICALFTLFRTAEYSTMTGKNRWTACFQNTWIFPTATSENHKFCSQSDQPTLQQMQQNTEKHKMKKKIEQKWMKDQKTQINFQKKRSLRKMKRSSEKQDLPSPLFESFSVVIIVKGLRDKSMAVHGQAV